MSERPSGEGARRVLCAHADQNGEGAHWKNEGEPCCVELTDKRSPCAESAAPLDDETRRKVVQILDGLFKEHEDHPWHQVGRCVYCGPCRARLYQGTMPADHPRWTPPPRRTPADDMRARWGMD